MTTHSGVKPPKPVMPIRRFIRTPKGLLLIILGALTVLASLGSSCNPSAHAWSALSVSPSIRWARAIRAHSLRVIESVGAENAVKIVSTNVQKFLGIL